MRYLTNCLIFLAESISTDSVRNCLKLFEKWSVIEVCNQRGMRLISLNTLYEMSRESLNSIVKKIEAVVPKYNASYFSQQKLLNDPPV